MLSQAAPSQAHLLIVDDRPDDVRLLVEMLRSARYRISVATDGRQAYNRAVALTPDLILMDVHMPGADGFMACRLLQADPATAWIPIVFLTAAGSLDHRLEGLRNGGVDYILKPYAPEEVLARVRIHLSRSILFPPAGQPDSVRQAALPSDQLLAEAAANFLRNHLSAAHTLESIARAVGTHEKRLSRVFRAHLGVSVFEFIRQERLRVAQRLLSDTALRVVDIAQEVGFSSAANFATAFRDEYGTTPTAFREDRSGGTSRGTALA